MQKLIIDIDNRGGMTIEATGIVGNSCSTEVGKLRNLVGTDAEEKKKPEYYQTSRSDIRGQGN